MGLPCHADAYVAPSGEKDLELLIKQNNPFALVAIISLFLIVTSVV